MRGMALEAHASVVVGVLLSLVTAVPALAGQDSGSGRKCRDVQVPVALAEEQPAGRSPETIQLLVHGGVYTGGYWEFPDPSGGTDRYNYAAAANKAGFTTLAIDRIGSGRSSHPLSTKITLESNVFTVHQVVQAIRRGEITAPAGKQFHKVVYVGHSYGTGVGWFLATDYGEDLDAAVFTGAFGERPSRYSRSCTGVFTRPRWTRSSLVTASTRGT